jgi:GNAT superfamily N-acetyltransferase
MTPKSSDFSDKDHAASKAIRWATPADAADLALVVREIAVHYQQPEIPIDRSEAVAAEWLAASTERHFALAHVGRTIAGLAYVSIAYPGGDLGRVLFLKELFVRDRFRGDGVGEALLAFLAEHCLAEGIGRIDFTTENWNDGALRFYDRLGAARQEQKVFLRFDREALGRRAARRG